jgi:hypothetical protein
MTHYKEDFRNVLQYCNNNDLYLGVGNPDAKILIIGKENTKDRVPQQEEPEEYLVRENLQCWNDIVANQITYDQLEVDCRKYNSLFPFKGQEMHIERKNRCTCGTAPTWYYYQRLVDMIVKPSQEPKKPHDPIDFHQYVFQTELSQIPLDSSDEATPEERDRRRKSIEQRIKLLQEEPFFKKFPIIIMPIGHYLEEFGIEIKDLFGLQWIPNEKANWCNIHLKEGEDRILIHTRQFSNGISYGLMRKIADACQNYYK